MTIKQMVERRYEYNLKILDVLRVYLEKYPQMRFGQALVNLNIIDAAKDPFYDESVEIFNRIHT